MRLHTLSIPIDQQLEAYTTWTIRGLFAQHGISINENSLLTCDGQDARHLFTFTRRQLIDFLRAHPDRAKSYLERCCKRQGIHDVGILEERGSQYAFYWQFHGKHRSEKVCNDLFVAAADWLMSEYGMQRDENDA